MQLEEEQKNTAIDMNEQKKGRIEQKRNQIMNFLNSFLMCDIVDIAS